MTFCVSAEDILITEYIDGLTAFELSQSILDQEIPVESTTLNPLDIIKVQVMFYRFLYWQIFPSSQYRWDNQADTHLLIALIHKSFRCMMEPLYSAVRLMKSTN